MTSVLFRNGALLDPLQPELLPGHEVLVEDGRIKEVSDRPINTASARVIDLKGKTLMPGLIDLHVHVIAVEFNLPRVMTLPNVLVTLRAVPLMRAMLRRGFTTIRDAGGAGYPFKQAVEAGLAEGPRMFVSGRALSQTGGHGDMRTRTDYMPPDAPCGCCVRVGALTRVADGVDEVRRAAEAANRVDLLHVPGGQVAGMLSEQRNNVPAREIVERMVSEAAQILNDMRSQYVGA